MNSTTTRRSISLYVILYSLFTIHYSLSGFSRAVGKVEQKRCQSVIVLLGGVECRNQNPLDFKAIVDKRFPFRFGDVFGHHQQSQPVLGFGCFFEGYLKFGDKISFAHAVYCFIGIGSDRSTAADNLL